MRNYKTFSELKTLAKRQMSGNLSTLICTLIVQELIIFLTTGIVVSLIPGNDPVSNIFYYAVTFIIQLLSGLLQAGCCLMYLHCSCNMPFNISDLFYCFKNSPDKAIKVECILAVINTICMIPSDIILAKTPAVVTYESMLSPEYTNYMMYSTCVTMLCSFVYVFITLGFFPVFYMMFDFPDYSVKEIYQNSWNVMKGQKLRYFLLELSFIPWIILGVFTCGIALLWIIPYINMTSTNFYLDIMSAKSKGEDATIVY